MEIEKITIPVASKSNQLKGITFSEKIFLTIPKHKSNPFVYTLPTKIFEKLPKICPKYIEHG
jgi:hypothetical protein